MYTIIISHTQSTQTELFIGHYQEQIDKIEIEPQNSSTLTTIWPTTSVQTFSMTTESQTTVVYNQTTPFSSETTPFITVTTPTANETTPTTNESPPTTSETPSPINETTVTEGETPGTTVPAKKEEKDFYTGTYHLVESKNFDKFLAEMNVNFILRMFAKTAKPDVIITKNGDYYRVQSITPLKRAEFTFKFGEKFEYTRPDGEIAKSIMTLDGHKWHEKQIADKYTIDIYRDFNGTALIATGIVNKVSFVRIYNKVND